MRNYENPATVIGRDYFTQTTTSVKKIINRYLKTNHLYDDSGWLSDSTNQREYYSFDSDHESFELLTETDNIVDMVIRKSNYEEIFTRKYKKIQNVLAEMAGFLQIIFTVLGLISSPFIKKEYYETLTNSIYNFEVDPDPKAIARKPNKKRTSVVHKEKIVTFQSIMLDAETKKDSPETTLDRSSFLQLKKKKKNDEDIINNLFKVKESPLKLTYLEMFKGWLARDPDLEVKKTQRNIGVSSIFSQLDIKYILNKFAEIDKIKMLLLNEDQYQLFEYLPKPVIMKNTKINLNHIEKIENGSPLKMNFFVHQNDMILKAKRVQKAFDNIIKKQKMNKIDQKLIQILDNGILKVLKANTYNFPEKKKSKFSKLPFLNGLPPIEKKEGEIESLTDIEKESEFSEKKGNIVTERNNGVAYTFS